MTRPRPAINRRTFLWAASALSARAYAGVVGANERVNVAVVGAGGHGARNLAVLAGKADQDFAPRGMLAVSYDRHVLLPEQAFRDFEPPEPSIPPSDGHHQQWIDACRGQRRPLCHFGYSMRVTETVLLGNVAFRSGKKLHWNADRLAIDDAPEAERLLRREYREGWTL